MARFQLLALIRHAGGTHADDTDADLLGRFVAGDHSAFAELVRRYARLVWGQCRNLLPIEADADDAFQATFLALSRSAKSIRDTDRLGPWLYAVAYRVCLNSRRAAARRTKRERRVASVEGTLPVADSAWDAAAVALHEEVSRLPESLRVPFVLCCLEGKAPTDAAKQLGMKWGTFSARLSRAKQRLLDRLSARGIGAAVAIGVISSGANASAAIIERVLQFGINGASVPASVQSLVTGVVSMGTRGKLLVSLAMAIVGVVALVVRGGTSPNSTAHAAPVPKESLEVRAKKLEELWAMLIVPDEAVSSRALLELTARPKKDVIPFLADRLKPLKLTAERAKQLLTDLGDDKEEVAKAAFDELSYFDPLLALDMEGIVKAAEGKTRLQRLAALLQRGGDEVEGIHKFVWCDLKYMNLAAGAAPEKHAFDVRSDPNKPVGFKNYMDRKGYQGNVLMTFEYSLTTKHRPEWRRLTRALMLLEHINTPEAVKVLDAMATGHPDAGPTIAAKDALERLKK